MRGIFGLATLAFIGVIIADLALHPAAVTGGLSGLDSILKTTFSSMLGASPYTGTQYKSA